jgi:UDP-N-acetyl-alpha-D-quinovosamine dehydrogenase
MPERRVLVTGASGFVGNALCDRLEVDGWQVRKALRSGHALRPHLDVDVGDIGASTDWRAALKDVQAVIHLAARTHVMREQAQNPLAAYRAINVDGTRCLAEAAAAGGVQRFIFMSSVKVNGERTRARPFREADEPCPEDPYGLTKLEAESELQRVAENSSMGLTIIRPPLVYGPGVKGNFLALMRLIAKGVPLPLASINNSRSMIYLDNLVSAVAVCLADLRAAGQTFLVSDGEDFSTAELVRRLAASLGAHPRLLPCPPAFLRAAGTVLGKQGQIARLTESLQIDSTKIRHVLGWETPSTAQQGLIETARWFVSREDGG